jgi:oligoribonuclease NrnB/cAMP/cGMP phosphodiesterase (DHH superfamily)
LWLTPKSVNKNNLAIPSTNEKRREQNGGISDRKLMMNKEIRAIKEIAVLVELKLKVLDFHVVAKHLLIAWGQ